jgi:hypothetical protein
MLCGIGLVMAILSQSAGADEAPTKEPGTLREMIDASVDEIHIFADANVTERAKPLVALRWANNSRGDGSEDAATALYIYAGRPLAVACFYPWNGRLVRDFEGIARRPVVGRRDGAIIWHPESTAVQFADVPDAPPPEPTRSQRLRQMKSLAEQFGSTMLGWKSDDSDREELRLLPRPLCRYEPTEGEIIGSDVFDGAVFAFVMGTDPESLLLLEAVQQGDKTRWQYAFARRTSGELEGRHRDKVVWTAPRYPGTHDPREPHFSVGTLIPPELLQANKKGRNEAK